MYVKQEIIQASHCTGIFYIKNTKFTTRRLMSYNTFKDLAESDAYRLNDAVNDKIAGHFWSTLLHSKSLSVPNIEDSLFATREEIFNMARLPSLLTYHPDTIPGRFSDRCTNE